MLKNVEIMNVKIFMEGMGGIVKRSKRAKKGVFWGFLG